jgi:hypothetical protein
MYTVATDNCQQWMIGNLYLENVGYAGVGSTWVATEHTNISSDSYTRLQLWMTANLYLDGARGLGSTCNSIFSDSVAVAARGTMLGYVGCNSIFSDVAAAVGCNSGSYRSE